jgi:hypothetical protein
MVRKTTTVKRHKRKLKSGRYIWIKEHKRKRPRNAFFSSNHFFEVQSQGIILARNLRTRMEAEDIAQNQAFNNPGIPFNVVQVSKDTGRGTTIRQFLI